MGTSYSPASPYCFGRPGLLGTGLLFALLAMLFIDAYAVSRSDDFMGALALGMMGVVAVIALSLPYAAVMDSPGVELSILVRRRARRGRACPRRAIRAPEAPRRAQPLAVRAAGAR